MSDLETNMRAEGYEYGAPSLSPRALVDGASIDAEVCADSKCAECGHEGLRYEPYHKAGSYRAFSVCPECGQTEEF